VAHLNAGEIFVRLCALAAVGVCVWSLRRSNRAAKTLEEEIATRVDRKELTDDEAFEIVVKQRSALAFSKAKKTWLFFILTVIAVTPFMAPLPLNVYWSPWGQTVLLVCVFAFFMTVLNTAFWWSEWYTRRQMEKESKANSAR
jgi:hypothetical protein